MRCVMKAWLKTNMTKKKSRRSVLAFMTPVGAFRRGFDSLAKTKEVLTQTTNDMVANLPDQNREDSFPVGDIRNIKDSKLRYKAMYEEHNWTPAEIIKQKRTCNHTKLVAFVMAVVSFFAVIGLTINASLWVTIVLAPVACVMLLLGVAKGFQFAQYETQLDLEELISAREFVARKDFFRRLLG